jgi:hypothetical protein
MNFSKNSWHFNFAHRWGGLTMWDGEPVRTSLCEYVKKVALGIFLFCLLTFIASSFTLGNIAGFYILATDGVAAWTASAGFFLCNIILFAVIASAVFVYTISLYHNMNDRRILKEWAIYKESNPDACYYTWREDQYRAKKNRRSLLGEWIKAKKEKVCPLIIIE